MTLFPLLSNEELSAVIERLERTLASLEGAESLGAAQLGLRQHFACVLLEAKAEAERRAKRRHGG